MRRPHRPQRTIPCKSAMPSRAAPRWSWVARAVIVETLLIAQELFPGNVSGVSRLQHNGPVHWLDLTGPALDARSFTGQEACAGLGSSVDVDPSIGGIVEDRQDAAIGQRLPGQFAVMEAAPTPRGKEQVVCRKMLDHDQGRTRLIKQVKDEPDGLLNLLIRIEHELTGGVIAEARGRTEMELAFLSFFQLAAQEATAQPVEFRLAHSALEAQQQSVIVLTGIIDTFFIDDQSVG